MKKKFLALLKSKNPHVGVSDKAFDRVASFYEKNGLLKEESSDEEIEKLAEGAETLLIGMKAESDSKLEEFKKKNNSQESKKDDSEKQSETDKKDDAKPGEQPDIAKLIAEALKPLSEEISGLKTQKQQESLSEKLVKALDEKKVPKAFYNSAITGRQFKDEAEIDEFVTSLETGYNDFKKEIGQEGLGQVGKTVTGGGGKTEASQDEINAVIDGII